MASSCKCATPPFWHLDYEGVELGMDSDRGLVELNTCKYCGQVWFNYLIEDPHYSHSGRWWRVPVPAEARALLRVEDARDFVQRQPWCFVGGCAFDSTGHRVEAPFVVR
jgi:hypothetical protein